MQAASRPAAAPPTCWPSPRSVPSPAMTGSTPSGTRARFFGEDRGGSVTASWTGLSRGFQPRGPLHTRAVRKASEPWGLRGDCGSGPRCASHIPQSWPLLPRRLPNRVPSLRMLRSFFTDGVSGVCVQARVLECWPGPGIGARPMASDIGNGLLRFLLSPFSLHPLTPMSAM